ncbi:MAG: translation initiation factor 6 [Candidatus Woesearchaeota archaeon]|nr:translation initiation factor 6 [Candidatus Woesearchaeota archaeon]
MKALKTSLNGNPNVGSLIFVNNKFGIVSPRYFKKYKKELEETFQVPFYQLTISGTDLWGVFATGNDEVIIVPEIAFPDEIEALKKICKEHDLKLIITNDKATALGNLILMNNQSIILSHELNKNTVKKISEETNLKTIQLDEDVLIGSLCAVNNSKAVVSPMIFNEKSEFLKQALNAEILEMTTNFGNNFISSGLALNDKGYVISELSSPVETYEIDQFLREE